MYRRGSSACSRFIPPIRLAGVPLLRAPEPYPSFSIPGPAGREVGSTRRTPAASITSASALRQVLEAADRERRPALEGGAEHAPGIAAERLVEAHQVTPVWILAKARIPAVAGAAAGRVGHEQAGEPARQLARHLVEVHHPARAG